MSGRIWARRFFDSCLIRDSQSTASFAPSFGESGVCKLMSIPQQLGTIGVIVLGTMLTHFLPFFIFPDNLFFMFLSSSGTNLIYHSFKNRK